MRSTAILGLGSNVGANVLLNLDRAYRRLYRDGVVSITDSSHAYLSRATVLGRLAPEHGDYVNAALRVETELLPLDLLRYLKSVERSSEFQRDANAARHSSRTLDLDILLYGNSNSSNSLFTQSFDSPELTIPHARLWERDFVTRPLADILPSLPLPSVGKQQQATVLGTLASYGPTMTWLRGSTCKTLAIFNATPDSFSDGGLLLRATNGGVGERARAVVSKLGGDSCCCLDIGGESTRPGAPAVSVDEELARVLPCIDACLPHCSSLSIDTTKLEVAKHALERGCTVINDVSCGRNEALVRLAGAGSGGDVVLGANLVLMHSQGDPQSMDSLAREDDNIIDRVGRELRERVDFAAQHCAVPRWRLIIDPGIGFAKTHRQSRVLLTCANELRRAADPASHSLPVMIAHSRKRFLRAMTSGTGTDWASTEERERVNALATQLAVEAGADMVRVHVNV